MRARFCQTVGLVSIFFLSAAAPSPLQQAQGPSPNRTDAAIARGVAWLVKRQNEKGAFPDDWASAYPTGSTALALYALGKAASDDDVAARAAIARGFEFLLARRLDKVYAVSLGIMALEARYGRPDAEGRPPSVKVLRQRLREHGSERERKWLPDATAWLVRQQDQPYWNYPGQTHDLSNTQFAVLALAAARRLGIELGQEPFRKLLEELLAAQETQGPEVAEFPVPAADGPLKGEGQTREGRGPLRARGWGYVPKEAPKGSMTAAGLACLIVCKAELEGEKAFKAALAAKVDAAIRDGAAWLAANFSAQQHPKTDGSWYYYWMFSLQRAGQLTGAEAFGPHFWYENGAAQILSRQEADGRWEWPGPGQRCGPVAGTSFALLFLRRATDSVIERPVSGGSLISGTTFERLDDGRYEVRFAYTSPRPLERIAVAGSFNDWKAEALPMQLDPDAPPHTYRAKLVLAAGRQRYKFVIDNTGGGQEWLLDPSNRLRERDDQGHENSLLDLP